MKKNSNLTIIILCTGGNIWWKGILWIHNKLYVIQIYVYSSFEKHEFRACGI